MTGVGLYQLLRWRQVAAEVDLLMAGSIGLQDLAIPLADLYTLGFLDGRASLAPVLAEVESAADRYYRQAYDPSARRQVQALIPYAQLCRIRGQDRRAAAVEESLARRLTASTEVS